MGLQIAITDGIVITGTLILLAVIVMSWLANVHSPKVSPAGSSLWFDLPGWAQIVAGIGAIVLFIGLGYLLWLPLPLDLLPTLSAALNFIGLAVFLTGLSLALWARWALDAMYGVSTGLSAPLRAQHRLIQRGPYAFVRHPMYLGYWLVFAGVELIYRTWTPLVLLDICVPSFFRRARREESTLAKHFGAEWQEYAARTNFLIPWVY